MDTDDDWVGLDYILSQTSQIKEFFFSFFNAENLIIYSKFNIIIIIMIFKS